MCRVKILQNKKGGCDAALFSLRGSLF